MVFAYFDRVKETSATMGTGALTLAGAAPGGFITFASVYTIGDTLLYGITDQSGSAWEVGMGTYSSANVLTRTTVQASSNAGALVNFTSGALFAFVDLAASAANLMNTSSVIGLFGNGQDGAYSAAAGSVTLTRDMYYSSMTPSGTAEIITGNYRIFCSGNCDMTNAPAGWLKSNGAAGSNGVAAGNANTIGGTGVGGSVGTGFSGANGGAGGGTTTPGSNGGSITANGGINGGLSGAGGNGGASATAAGGTGSPASILATNLPYGFSVLPPSRNLSTGAVSYAGGGGSGGGAGGGAGDATRGGSGGAGAGGGGVIYLIARTITRSSSTTGTGAIQVKGGAGGIGGTSIAGIRGGGGGGAGGGGGWVYILYQTLAGTSKTGLIDISSGAGGDGGDGFGVGGIGGNGGSSGTDGRVTIGNVITGVITETVGVTINAGNAASGNTHGTGGAAVTNQVTL